MKISVIIPAYNEENGIARVLNIVVPLIGNCIHEVIVVDDGSSDSTRNIVETFSSVRLIIQNPNAGKSKAVARGVIEATGDYVLFLDADLIGLNSQNIIDLISPIIENIADVSISLRNYFIWKLVGLDPLSGERIFSKIFLEQNIDLIKKLPNFGLEVFLNSLIIKNNLRISIVLWKNVMSPFKHQKQGIVSGIKADIRMIRDILRTISIFDILLQIKNMLKLRV